MHQNVGYPGGTRMVKNPPASAADARDTGSIPGLGRFWRRGWQPTPVFLPGEFHGLYIVRRVVKSWTRLSDFYFSPSS